MGGSFLDGPYDRFAGFAGALLNPTSSFVVFALEVFEIFIREFGPLLLRLALGDVPVALDVQCAHSTSRYSLVRILTMGNNPTVNITHDHRVEIHAIIFSNSRKGRDHPAAPDKVRPGGRPPPGSSEPPFDDL